MVKFSLMNLEVQTPEVYHLQDKVSEVSGDRL